MRLGRAWLVLCGLLAIAGVVRADPIVNDTLALRIETSGAYVRVPSAASLDLTTSLTIELWACFDPSDSTPGAEIVKRGDGNNGYVLGINPETRIAGGIFEQNTNLVSMPPEFGDVWHHFAWTYDGSVSRLYYDGMLLQEAPYAGAVGTTTTDLIFGIGLEGDGTWNGATAQGWYDEIRVWNVARSSAQILEAFDQTLSGTESGLVGYWNFDRWDGTDLSSFGNDGELLGGARIEIARGADPVPEPGTIVLVAIALIVVAWRFHPGTGHRRAEDDATHRCAIRLDRPILRDPQ